MEQSAYQLLGLIFILLLSIKVCWFCFSFHIHIRSFFKRISIHKLPGKIESHILKDLIVFYFIRFQIVNEEWNCSKLFYFIRFQIVNEESNCSKGIEFYRFEGKPYTGLAKGVLLFFFTSDNLKLLFFLFFSSPLRMWNMRWFYSSDVTIKTQRLRKKKIKYFFCIFVSKISQSK